jgi:hypothetical protein
MRVMADIPDKPNFFSTIGAGFDRPQIADLYRKAGWRVRKCGWTDFKLESDWAEIILEGESPVLLHGSVSDLPSRAEELLAPLTANGVTFATDSLD